MIALTITPRGHPQHNWSVSTIDIKTAFLRGGEFEWNVHIWSPPEASTQKIRKLRKCIYGLTDASLCNIMAKGFRFIYLAFGFS